jgi:hypothetical protein
LNSVEGGAHQLQEVTAAQRVEAAMDREIPNWREINNDPRFHIWLDQVDPFSGHKRQDMVTDAYRAGHAARTLAFFHAYLREHTAVSPQPGIPPTQTGISADRLPLADLAVPGRGQAAAPQNLGAPEKRIWTGAEIAAFYRQKNQGRWVGREAEAARIEADFIAAPLEGRFRQ